MEGRKLKEILFAVFVLLTLVALPYAIVGYSIDDGKRIINVVGRNSPDTEPGVWYISEGRWDFLDFGKKAYEIEVNEGDEVTLYLTSMDVVHGFHLPAFNVSAFLYPGEVKVIKFTANESGEFPFSCNLPGRENSCGFGHLKMNGVVRVKR